MRVRCLYYISDYRTIKIKPGFNVFENRRLLKGFLYGDLYVKEYANTKESKTSFISIKLLLNSYYSSLIFKPRQFHSVRNCNAHVFAAKKQLDNSLAIR